MRIEILAREDISKVDISQWAELAKNSLFSNPFYEHWSLRPALEYLQLTELVYLVVAYEGSKLVSLFPVCLKTSTLGLRYLSVWQHDHCFICDPLCTNSEPFAKIFNYALRKLKASIIRIPQHSVLSYGDKVDNSSVIFTSTRGAIFNTSDIKLHLNNLPSKTRNDNERIKKRLFRETSACYITSAAYPNKNWLTEYCQLEHSGWKKDALGSILSKESVKKYYDEMHRFSKVSEQIEYQGLFIGDTAIAISFRLTTKNQAFEAKTSYSESYKRLYPGVVLELLNLDALSDSRFKFVDSSTHSDNKLINRLWPEQRKLVNSLYFSRKITGKALKAFYRIKRRFNL